MARRQRRRSPTNGTLGLETRKQVAADDDLPSRRGGDEADAYRQAQIAKADEQYDMLRSFRGFLQWRRGNAIILAADQVAARNHNEHFSVDGDRLHIKVK